VELEHLKIETRLIIDEKFADAWVCFPSEIFFFLFFKREVLEAGFRGTRVAG
jgi:hypothetical protein